jgi:hypothetical protein
MPSMTDAPDHHLEYEQLQSRVIELENELRLRMGDVNRLDRELRHSRADVAVKDEYIAQLSREADVLQSIRNLIAKIPFGLRITVLIEQRVGLGRDSRPGTRAANSVRPGKRAAPEIGRRRVELRRAVGRLAPHGTTRARVVNGALGMVHGAGGSSARSPGS